jgi:hypothetical protein
MPLCQCSSGLENEIRILVEEYFGHHLEEVKNYPPKGVFTIFMIFMIGSCYPKGIEIQGDV